jgi:hypothetical protein
MRTRGRADKNLRLTARKVDGAEKKHGEAHASGNRRSQFYSHVL